MMRGLCFSNGRRERGMSLVVTLIFLLLITLIGVSSMQNANLQERMAGSVKLRNESFQAAEAALRLGENAVAAGTLVMTVCDISTNKCQPPPSASTVNAAGAVASEGVTWVAAEGGLYAIQRLPIVAAGNLLMGNLIVSDTTTQFLLYRITAVGGFQGSVRTVVESIYVKTP